MSCPPHEWRFGKCRRCGCAEGQLARGGSYANPGSLSTGGVGCPENDGGKHRYKFGQCALCGQGEGGVRSGGRTGSGRRRQPASSSSSSSRGTERRGSGRRRANAATSDPSAPSTSSTASTTSTASSRRQGSGRRRRGRGRSRGNAAEPSTTPCPPHEWRFGKCRKCGAGEGQLAAQPGRFVNPGEIGGAGCPRNGGGKHRFKFGQCACGRRDL